MFSLCAFTKAKFSLYINWKGIAHLGKKEVLFMTDKPTLLPLLCFLFLCVVLGENNWIWNVYQVKERLYFIHRTQHVLISYTSTINEFWVIHRYSIAAADEWSHRMLCGQKKNLQKFVIQWHLMGIPAIDTQYKVRLYIWNTFKAI